MTKPAIKKFFCLCLLIITVTTLNGCINPEGLGGDIDAPTPTCPPGQMQSGLCERADFTAQCVDDDGNVVGTVECEQVTCWCSGPQTERHAIRGAAVCASECPRRGRPNLPPPINVTLPE
jgi:hypothetical protein